jgi:hypothetical protein
MTEMSAVRLDQLKLGSDTTPDLAKRIRTDQVDLECR